MFKRILIRILIKIINKVIINKRFLLTNTNTKKIIKEYEYTANSNAFINYNTNKLKFFLEECNINFIDLGLVRKNRHRLFILEDQRFELIKAISDIKSELIGIQFHFKEKIFKKNIINIKSKWYSLNKINNKELEKALNRCVMVSIVYATLKKENRVILGEKHAVELEIWCKQDSCSEYKRHYINDSMIRVSKKDYQSILKNDVNKKNNDIFNVKRPIDLVYTWVDDNDNEWLEEKNNYINDADKLSSATSNSRFKNRDELKYSLRSVETYASFINHIYIVSANQVPEWLDVNHPKITMIFHDEIIDKKYLPTFNSHAIEANLHNIEEISEQYIYMNDDVFFGGHVTAESFFTSNGKTKMFMSNYTYIPHTDELSGLLPIDIAAINVKKLLKINYNVDVDRKFNHVPFPILKSVMNEMSKEYDEEFNKTSASKFRSKTDISTTSFMYHYYAYIKGHALPGGLSNEYFDLNKKAHLRKLVSYSKKGEASRKQVFCINETQIDHGLEVDLKIKKFLTTYFPFKSSFEL